MTSKRMALRRGPPLTDRDVRLVLWTFQAGFATERQLRRLFFTSGGRSRCQARLAKLVAQRYLDRLPRLYPNAPAVYRLSRRSFQGLRLLRTILSNETVHRSPSPAAVEHTLKVNDCRIHFVKACRANGYELRRWSGEDELRPLTLRYGLLPDAYFQVARQVGPEEKKASFFLEVERSGKDERSLAAKFKKYGEFYYGGQYEQVFKAQSLRVLFLLSSEYGIYPHLRIDSLVRLCERMDVTMVLFAALDEFLSQGEEEALFSPIWRRPRFPKAIAIIPDHAKNGGAEH